MGWGGGGVDKKGEWGGGGRDGGGRLTRPEQLLARNTMPAIFSRQDKRRGTWILQS